MPVGVILSVGGQRHAASASAAAAAAGSHEKDAGVAVPSSVQVRRSLFESQQDKLHSSSQQKERNGGGVAQKPAAAVIASATRSEPPVRTLRATPRRPGGGGGGFGGSRSWYFGTDVSSAPEGTIAIRLPISTSPFASSPSVTDSAPAAHGAARITAIQPVMTPERRAQATVWDHVRFEGAGEIGPDPGLVAEARKLMMSDAGDTEAAETDAGEDGKRKKKLCFSSDPETYEYQSELSRIEELGITPDYPLGSFEVVDPTVRAAARRIDAAPALKKDLSSPLPAATSEIANYKSKLSSESFVWGERVDRPDSGQILTTLKPPPMTTMTNSPPATVHDSFTREHSSSEESARLLQIHHQQQPQQQLQQQQQQWSVSATADLLF